MIRTPEVYIKRQERRRRAGKVIPPCVGATLLRPFPVTTAYRKPGPLSQWSLGYHTGEDHAAPLGSLVNATSWGTVVCTALWIRPGVMGLCEGPVTQWGDSYGTHVVIRMADGSHDYGVCHLSRILVRAGQEVRPGQTLGLVGHSGGSGNFGPHLHLEARLAGGRFGSDVNPVLVKQAR
jgi:murein DD-endopeptidase MepM/ murein hydrolase activator NlpD